MRGGRVGAGNQAGTPQQPLEAGMLLEMESLSPEEVEAVEVYRSPGEWPAGFDRSEASCVVVIWRRRGGKEP